MRYVLIIATWLVVFHWTDVLAREWDLQDPLAQRIRVLADQQAYVAILDTVPPLVEAARARGDSLQLGRLICARGQAELGSGRVGDSLRSLARAQGLAEANSDTLTLLTALGVGALALGGQGRHEAAIELAARQADIARAADDSLGEAFANLSQGFANVNLGRYREAVTNYSRAESLFGEFGQSGWRLSALNGLGRAQHNLAQADSARATFLQVRNVAKELGDGPNEAAALTNLGVLEQTEFGSLERSAYFFEEAYRVRSEGTENFLDFEIVTNLVLIRSSLGHWQSAVELLEEARKTAFSLGAMSAYYVATVQLANLRMLQGHRRTAAQLHRGILSDPNAAEAHTSATLGLVDALASMDSVATALEIVQKNMATIEKTDPLLRNNVLLNLCRFLLLMGRTHDACEQAQELLDLDLAPDKLALAQSYRARCLALTGDVEGSWEALTMGFDAVERVRVQAESLNWREVEGSQRVLALTDAAAELVRARRRENVGASVEDIVERMQGAKARTVLDRLSSPVRAPSRQVNPVPFARVQQVLGPFQVAVDVFVGDREVIVVVIDRNQVQVRVVSDPRQMMADLNLFCEVASDRAVNEISVNAVGERVREALFGQMFGLLHGAKRIVFSPDGGFAAFPLGLLPDSDGEPLALERGIVRLPSLALLAQPAQRPASRGRSILALVGPKNDLVGAEAEIASLQKQYRDVFVVRGFEGLVDSLRTAAILHVAAHASVDEERLWHSGFRLANGDMGHDGKRTHLYASDILESDLGCDLAVLAGCKTGLGRTVGSSGVAGLSSAFLVAGASSVVATLWDIDDAATRDLVDRFYKELAAGKAVGPALQSAQMAIRSQPQTSHPHYWAGFIVVGDPDLVAVPLIAPAGLPRAGWWILALGGILVLGEQIRRRV